jgi:Tol biopolymer transport system component
VGGGAPDGGAPAECTLGEFTPPELITGLGRTGSLWGPNLSADGKTLAFSELDTNEDVFTSTRGANGAFGSAQPAPGINSPGANEGTPFRSDDGTSFYFYSDRTGGTGNRDLYVATRPGATGPFGMPGQVPGVNSTSNEHLLWVSADELEIYFTSNRAGGVGAYDLYHATRASKTAAFTPITSLTGVNSPEDDEAPSLTGDELTLMFASSRSGSFDIWMATRESSTATFGSLGPVPQLNSDDYESNVTLSRDGREVIFVSDRGGISQLYRATRDCR